MPSLVVRGRRYGGCPDFLCYLEGCATVAMRSMTTAASHLQAEHAECTRWGQDPRPGRTPTTHAGRPFRVFVYGTLRRGARNHALLREARPLGTWRTPPRYTLFDLGAYPGAFPGGRSSVAGEVYAVDARTLQRLDRLEDYPRLYDRERLETPWGLAWIYVLRRPPHRARRIPSGDWLRR